MKLEEKEMLEKRVDKYDELVRRINYLKTALKNLKDKKVGRISIGLKEETKEILNYSEQINDKQASGYFHVCWGIKEEGLVIEIFNALVTILENRLIKTEKDLEEL